MNDDERLLWNRYRECMDTKARELLVARYLPLVKYVAGRMAVSPPPGLDFSDILSFGSMGLIDAIERFDIDRGYGFQTFAVPRIRGAILDELRRYDWISRTGREKLQKLERTVSELSRGTSQPDDDSVREAMGLSDKAYKELLEIASRSYVVSLDDVLAVDDGELSRGESLESDIPSPLDVMEQQEELEGVASAVDNLPEREKLLISLYYYEGLTFKEIGRVMGVTESRVSQIHGRAVALLRAELSSSQGV